MTEEQIREALILIFQHLREQYSAIHSLAAEVAALRDSLIEIEPKYEQIFSQHRQQHQAEAGPTVFDDLERFDEIVEQLMREK